MQHGGALKLGAMFRKLPFASCVVVVATCCTFPAFAQPVERDPVKIVKQSPAVVAPPNIDQVLADETPIEGPLQGVVFLSEDDAVLSAVPDGVDTARVPLLDDPAFAAKISSFFGQPVSMKLIAAVEAEVANWARSRGMPFVSISTPEQEITGGVLQFRVQEFRVGARTTVARGRMSSDMALAEVRVQPGDTINAVELGEDLSWMSRSPFRDVTSDFVPGTEPGKTDMTVRVEESKPYLATLGYDNSGARTTGRNRIRTSLALGDFPAVGSVLSYQLAISPDAFTEGLAPVGGHASYQSHSFNFYLPTLPRQALAAGFDMIESNSVSSPFDIRSKIMEGTLGYQLLASELGLPPGSGQFSGGVEIRHSVLESRFGGTLATRNIADVVQLYAGWSYGFVNDTGSTYVGAELHFSPGGLMPQNNAGAFSVYSSGRVTNATYAYAKLNLDRKTDLPYEFRLDNGLKIQAASGPLIDTEQLTMGGDGAVRGYLPDDGALDVGVISRNTLNYVPGDWGGVATPFVLADFAVGRNLKTGADQTFASVGGGVDFNIGNHVSGSLYAAAPLISATVSKRSSVSINFRIGAQY